MRKNILSIIPILILAVIGSMGNGYAEGTVIDPEGSSDPEREPRSAETDSLKYVTPDSTVGLEWYETESKPHVDTLWLGCDSLGSVIFVAFEKGYRDDALRFILTHSESLTVINGVLIECANQANWPHNGGVLESE